MEWTSTELCSGGPLWPGPKPSASGASERTEMEEAMTKANGGQSIDQSDQVREEMRRRAAMRLMWRSSGEGLEMQKKKE